MAATPIEKRFKILCEITRAQHFAWREAVVECGVAVPDEVVDRMWEITGHQTADAYLKRLDRTRPLAAQVAESIAWSSECMGENAVVEPGAEGRDEAHVRHLDCPWHAWHQRLDLLEEDRRGCDIWFGTVVADVNAALGTNLKIETLETKPDGCATCLRRLWVDEEGA